MGLIIRIMGVSILEDRLGLRRDEKNDVRDTDARMIE